MAERSRRKRLCLCALCACAVGNAIAGGGCTRISIPGVGEYSSSKNVRLIAREVIIPGAGPGGEPIIIGELELVGDASTVWDSSVEAFKQGLQHARP